MGNGSFHISKRSDELLTELMVTLDVDRPLALKIALSEGLLGNTKYHNNGIRDKGREIPDDVVWKGFEHTLFYQLIIQKEEKRIDESELDEYYRFYIEEGLVSLKSKIDKIPSTENFLLYLLNDGNDSDDRTEFQDESILNLLGF